MTLLRKINQNRRNKKKAQTALEYALVVGAITLVIMAAWNTVGKDVQDSIRGKLASDIMDNLNKGNATVTQ